MLDKTKTDKNLGLQVKEFLIVNGVETPTVSNTIKNEKRITKIEKSFTDIMNVLGLDLKDDSLQDTPKRVAKMYVDEIFWGLDYDNFPKITTVDNKFKYDEMIIEKNIKSMSVCEHHFVTIDGKCHIGYIPKNKVLGLSKLNRVVEFFSRRPQVQERLTEQIYYALRYILGTEDIAVVLEGTHYCVKSRGIEDQNSSTTTSKMGGSFKNNSNLRHEFLKLI